MDPRGSMLAWYRFLDVTSIHDAEAEVARVMRRLEDVLGDLTSMWQAFIGCPDDDVEASLFVARA